MLHSESTQKFDRIPLPIYDQKFKADPYPFYRSLQQSGEKLAAISLPGGLEAWLVLDYDLTRHLINSPDLSKDFKKCVVGESADGSEASASELHPIYQHLHTTDPPEHTSLRSLLATEFTRSRVLQMRPQIQEIADRLIADMTSMREANLLQAFASPFSLHVICQFLGVPERDIELIGQWLQRLNQADLEGTAVAHEIAANFQNYLLDLAVKECDSNSDTLFSRLVTRHADGDLSEKDLISSSFLLLSAGYETAMNLIGNSVLTLLTKRGIWDEIQSGQYELATVVEELLRWECPLEFSTLRVAIRKIELEGVSIEPGEKVLFCFYAANRDPQYFMAGEQLQFQCRHASAHMSFGFGIHYCLGAGLARLESEVAISSLLRTFPEMRLNPEQPQPQWLPGLTMRGLDQLPVRFDSEDFLPEGRE
ncbi:cytochrome P450 [Gimesia chilikensis]|uniref:cytochrome P450 n=1 Tax=Gimesia chilikensis TaxID=2605989 RepID=UPI001659E7EB|nr:cytochrome P450 [Gimesia chilikensis]